MLDEHAVDFGSCSRCDGLPSSLTQREEFHEVQQALMDSGDTTCWKVEHAFDSTLWQTCHTVFHWSLRFQRRVLRLSERHERVRSNVRAKTTSGGSRPPIRVSTIGRVRDLCLSSRCNRQLGLIIHSRQHVAPLVPGQQMVPVNPASLLGTPKPP